MSTTWAFLRSVILHVLVIAFIFMQFSNGPSINPGDQAQIKAPIKAFAVNSKVLDQQLAAIAHAKQRKKQQEIARQRRLQQQARKRARIAHEKRMAAIAHAKHVALLKRQRAEHLEALRRQRQLAAKKRQQEADLKHALSAESAQLAAAKARHVKRVVSHYFGLIVTKIQRHWHPTTSTPQMVAKLRLRLDAKGDVISIDLVKSSGNPAFDQSARVAVYRSQPLPVPNDKAVFQAYFHVLDLNARPGNNNTDIAFD